VVDMARMQYGEAGRGTYGEPFFLGTLVDYHGSVWKICEGFEVMDNLTSFQEVGTNDEMRLKLVQKGYGSVGRTGKRGVGANTVGRVKRDC
jgi:hypothetical protein